jgi:hypothetical protein
MTASADLVCGLLAVLALEALDAAARVDSFCLPV